MTELADDVAIDLTNRSIEFLRAHAAHAGQVKALPVDGKLLRHYRCDACAVEFRFEAPATNG